MHFVPDVKPVSEKSGPCKWFIIRDYRVLVLEKDGRLTVPFIEDRPISA